MTAHCPFMVGGDKEIFEKYKGILETMGSSVVLCGDVGAGNTTKLTNQIIVAANIAAVAEGFMLARKANVDPNLVFEAIKGGLAGSNVMNAKVPMMIADNFAPWLPHRPSHQRPQQRSGSRSLRRFPPLPLTALIMEMFQTLRLDGCGSDDHSALAKYYAKLANATISGK